MKQTNKGANEEVVKTTIRVRRELWNAVLHRSIDENVGAQEIVERALEQYLKQKGGRR